MLRDTPGKTEWEDALIKHGIMEAPEVVPTEDELALAYQEAMAARDPLAGKSLEQLDELEDDVDDQILNVYRYVVRQPSVSLHYPSCVGCDYSGSSLCTIPSFPDCALSSPLALRCDARHREKRLAEMAARASKARFGTYRITACVGSCVTRLVCEIVCLMSETCCCNDSPCCAVPPTQPHIHR